MPVYWRKIWGCLVLSTLVLAVPGHGWCATLQDQAVIQFVGVMRQTLKLTDAQVRQVASVVREYFDEVGKLQADGVSGEALSLKLKALREDMDAGLENYLSAEQMALWRRGTTPTVNNTRKAAKIRGSGRGSLSNDDVRASGDGVLQSAGPETARASGVW
ncbi:MAG: hypothetical protein HGA80_04090 [Candidatus Omnitrophica bacterium]|nr:hypothetical protein [Candidatus Omnitrophota bacterium]